MGQEKQERQKALPNALPWWAFTWLVCELQWFAPYIWARKIKSQNLLSTQLVNVPFQTSTERKWLSPFKHSSVLAHANTKSMEHECPHEHIVLLWKATRRNAGANQEKNRPPSVDRNSIWKHKIEMKKRKQKQTERKRNQTNRKENFPEIVLVRGEAIVASCVQARLWMISEVPSQKKWEIFHVLVLVRSGALQAQILQITLWHKTDTILHSSMRMVEGKVDMARFQRKIRQRMQQQSINWRMH